MSAGDEHLSGGQQRRRVLYLAAVMLPVAVNVPAAGSYSSALASIAAAVARPPAMSTFPLGNNVAVCPYLPAVMLPVAVNVPVAGSYSSALARACHLPSPPAMSTFPLGNNVAVCPSSPRHAARGHEDPLPSGNFSATQCAATGSARGATCGHRFTDAAGATVRAGVFNPHEGVVRLACESTDQAHGE